MIIRNGTPARGRIENRVLTCLFKLSTSSYRDRLLIFFSAQSWSLHPIGRMFTKHHNRAQPPNYSTWNVSSRFAIHETPVVDVGDISRAERCFDLKEFEREVHADS